MKNLLNRLKKILRTKGSLIAFLVYGITDEIHQSFVPMRDASAFDIFADGLGSFAGAYCNKHFNLKEI